MILNPKDIIENEVKFDSDMKARGESVNSSLIKMLYTDWRDSLQELENTAHSLNKLSKNFSPENRVLCDELSERRKVLEVEVHNKKAALDWQLDRIPNWLDSSVPIGKNSDDNVPIEYHNEHMVPPKSRHHEEIAETLGWWYRDEAVAMSGSRFVVLSDKLAKLERVLMQFALHEGEKAGFLEFSVPYLILEHALYNTGQLPKFEQDYFRSGGHALIPTGEMPLVNLVAGKKLEHSLRFMTGTSCFRKEAGSLGRDTKGLIRLHQFQKVELVCITDAANSHTVHLEMLSHIRHLLDLLVLPYRVVEVCSGDLGFTARKQFDVEVFMPSSDKYVEVASCSNCGDFQARRMGTKMNGELAHTLNGTGLACGRIIAAILEHYCYDEFKIPSVLESYWL